jgi:hypothetical protein
MSDRSITFEQWTQCEEAMMGLRGGLGLLLNVWDAAAHGHNFDRKATADGLYFLMQALEREVEGLNEALGFKRRADASEGGANAEADQIRAGRAQASSACETSEGAGP